MYKESCKRRSGAFLPVVLVITVGFCLLSLPTWLDSFFNWGGFIGKGIYEICVFICVGISLYIIIKKYLYEYTYFFIDDEIIIHQKIGKREITLCSIDVKNIHDMGRGKSNEYLLAKYHVAKKNRCYNIYKKDEITYVIFSPQGSDENEALMFSPSEQMFSIILEKVLDNSDEL